MSAEHNIRWGRGVGRLWGFGGLWSHDRLRDVVTVVRLSDVITGNLTRVVITVRGRLRLVLWLITWADTRDLNLTLETADILLVQVESEVSS